MALIEQVRRDICKFNERGLGSIDELNILTNLLLCEWRLTEREKKEDDDKYSEGSASTRNNVVDRDVNKLFYDYQAKRELYRSNNDKDHENKMINALNALTSEIYDLIYVIKCNAILAEERNVIDKFIEMIDNI